MRILTAAAVLGLLASAYLAPRHHEARESSFPMARFATPDARQRLREGEAARQLGVAMDACHDLVRDHPGDMGPLRDRIRTGFLIGAVGLGQATMPELVWNQAKAYIDGRPAIDPDGKFLEEIRERWIHERLHYDVSQSVYPRAAMAVFLAARGDPAGREMLLELARRGPFHLHFFPLARRYHPGFAAAETLIVQCMETGDLHAKVEAGVTLLDYNNLFGAGGDLVERYLPAIRSSVKEMRQRMRSLKEQPSDAGRAAILGMALLAIRGDEEEKRALVATKAERELLYYAPFADVVRIARIAAGLDPAASMGPLTVRFKDLDSLDQDLYYVAVAHHAARMAKEGGLGGREELLDLIEAGLDGTPGPKVLALQMLPRLAPERGAAAISAAIEGRAAPSVYAGIIGDKVEDPVALFLPALASKEPDFAAMAAASMRGPDGPRALER